MFGQVNPRSANGLPSRWYAVGVVALATLFLGLTIVALTTPNEVPSTGQLANSDSPSIGPAKNALNAFKLQTILAVSVVAGIATLFPSRVHPGRDESEEPIGMISELTGHPVLASLFEKPITEAKPQSPRFGSVLTLAVFISEVVVTVAIMLSIAMCLMSDDIGRQFLQNPLEGFVEVVRQAVSAVTASPAAERVA